MLGLYGSLMLGRPTRTGVMPRSEADSERRSAALGAGGAGVASSGVPPPPSSSGEPPAAQTPAVAHGPSEGKGLGEGVAAVVWLAAAMPGSGDL